MPAEQTTKTEEPNSFLHSNQSGAVFGNLVNDMGRKLVRSIGLKPAKANLGLTNLTYNFKRFVMWEKKKQAA